MHLLTDIDLDVIEHALDDVHVSDDDLQCADAELKELELAVAAFRKQLEERLT